MSVIGVLYHSNLPMSKPLIPMSNRIKLNIGGTCFLTTIQTLTRYPNTFFSRIACPEDSLFKQDPDGAYFIDRDPTSFGYILTYLRDHIEMFLTQKEAKRFIADIDFYGIGLVEYMSTPPLYELSLLSLETKKAAHRRYTMVEDPDSVIGYTKLGEDVGGYYIEPKQLIILNKVSFAAFKEGKYTIVVCDAHNIEQGRFSVDTMEYQVEGYSNFSLKTEHVFVGEVLINYASSVPFYIYLIGASFVAIRNEAVLEDIFTPVVKTGIKAKKIESSPCFSFDYISISNTTN